MPLGHPGIRLAARKFGISERTLQRRLHDAGYSYSELVDEVRYATACGMLKDTQMSMTDIARALGFAHGSNFSRAFHRWSGMTPSTYRNKLYPHTTKRHEIKIQPEKNKVL